MKAIIIKFFCVIVCVSAIVSCSKKEDADQHAEETALVDFGEGVYRPNPFKFLDNIPPFSWLGMPDSVIGHSEITISFNEDAVRSKSSGTIYFADASGNRIEGLQIGDKGQSEIAFAAADKDVTIPVTFRVNPEVGDSLLTGSIMVSADKLDVVNDTELLSYATPVAGWQLKHQTGINWWRWLLLVLVVALILAIIFLICYGLVKAFIAIGVALSPINVSMPKFNNRRRRERKPKRKRRKKPKPFKLNIAFYQWLLPRIYDLPPFLFHISYFFLPKKIKTFLKDEEVAWLPYSSWKKGTVNLSFKESIISLFIGKTAVFELKYKHGEIDFEPVALGKVKLPLCRLHGCIPKNAIDPRPKVWIAQEIAAEKFIKSKKGKKILAEYTGKKSSEISYQDFKDWKEDDKNRNKKGWNPLVPHETSDGAYILYVPHKYHSMDHYGGVHYLKKFRTYVEKKNRERQENADFRLPLSKISL